MRSCHPKSALPQHLLQYLTLLQRQTQEHALIVRSISFSDMEMHAGAKRLKQCAGQASQERI
jgi:hypothetical protein